MKRYLTTFVAVAMVVGFGLTIGCQRAVEPVNDLGPPPDVRGSNWFVSEGLKTTDLVDQP